MSEFLKRLFHGKHIVYGSDYLTRFYLKGDGSGKTWELYLHRIFKEDGARAPHNHPWPWLFSIILTGWYDEIRDGFEHAHETPAVRKRWINIMPSPAVFHRITTVSARPVWTLVIVPPKDDRKWGFLDRTGDRPKFVAYSSMTLADGVSTEDF